MIKRVFHDHKNEDKRRKRTICVIQDKGIAYIGIAICSSEDQYVKKIGRMIAEDRADNVYKKRNSEIRDLIQNDFQFSINIESEIVRGIVSHKFDIPPFMLEHVPEIPDDEIPF